jgi:hypothetical protein
VRTAFPGLFAGGEHAALVKKYDPINVRKLENLCANILLLPSKGCVFSIVFNSGHTFAS